MQIAIKHFRESLQRVRALGGLYVAIDHMTTPVVDATDLLRAQIVLAVSALDYYIHEIARIGMLEIFDHKRPPTVPFQRFKLSVDAVMVGLTGGGVASWFDAEIREQLGYRAFQHPDKIADAIRLFSSIEFWPTVAAKMGLSVPETKERLKLIIERRNKIAHEADLDPSYPGIIWPIYPSDVTKAVDFIEKLCEAINIVVT